jgi:hypothetical protein
VAQVVLALVARAVKVVLEDQVVRLELVDRAMTESVSRGLVTVNLATDPRVQLVMVSVSRGLVMGNRVMVSVSRGLATVSLATDPRVQLVMASESPGPEMQSPVIVQLVQCAMVSASPGPEMQSPVIVQLVRHAMASVSPGPAMANPVTDHPGLEEIARRGTPVRRVRVATALSAITKPTR